MCVHVCVCVCVYVCVCVCLCVSACVSVCVCGLLYSCSRINEVQIRLSSHVFLDLNSWICKISNLFRLLLFRSKTCNWSVATLLIVSFALER